MTEYFRAEIQLDMTGTNAFTGPAMTISGTGVGSAGAINNIASGTNSYNGNITMGAATTIQDNGALTLSGTLTNAGYLLTVNGSGTPTLGGIVSGTGGLTYSGSGTLPDRGRHVFWGDDDQQRRHAATGQRRCGGLDREYLEHHRQRDPGIRPFRGDDVCQADIRQRWGDPEWPGRGHAQRQQQLYGRHGGEHGRHVEGGQRHCCFGNGSAVTVNGTGTLALNGYNVSIGSLTGASGSTVSLGGNTLTNGEDSVSTTFAGTITGTGGLTENGGSNTLILSGSNTYSGATLVTSGILSLGSAGAVQNTTSLTVGSGGELQFRHRDEHLQRSGDHG